MERGICADREMDGLSILLKQIFEKVLLYLFFFLGADLKPK